MPGSRSFGVLVFWDLRVPAFRGAEFWGPGILRSQLYGVPGALQFWGPGCQSFGVLGSQCFGVSGHWHQGSCSFGVLEFWGTDTRGSQHFGVPAFQGPVDLGSHRFGVLWFWVLWFWGPSVSGTCSFGVS